MGLATLNNIVEKTDTLTDGLVGYWPLNEGKDNIVYDYSGNKNNGSLVSSPIWQNSSLKFGGVSDYINLQNRQSLISAFDNNKIFSCSIFAYPLSTVSTVGFGFRSLFSKAFTSHISPYYQFDISQYANNDSGIYIGVRVFRSDTLGNYIPICGSLDNAAPLNKWTHIVGILNLLRGSTYLYINGILVNSRSGMTGTYNNHDTVLCLAANKNITSATAFHGSLFDARIYNRALSPFEIKKLYNLGLSNIQNKKSII